MKTLIYFLITLILLVGCTSIKNTSNYESSKYKDFKNFKGDSSEYLTYNFIDNKQKYIGKKLNVLFNDLEFEIKSYGCVPAFNNKDYINYVSISFYNFQESINKTARKEKMNALIIVLEKPIMEDSVRNLNTLSYNWTEAHKSFLGEKNIKDIQLYIHTVSK